MTENSAQADILGLTAQIVAAHVAHNPVPAETLPALIERIYKTLAGVEKAAPAPARPQPAVPVKKSIFPDYLVCLEDGRKLKMLKRHLQAAYHLTPEQYRERWNLAPDYPMVAANYARHRSTLAKKSGLGTKPRQSARR
jgi:predicted transcriptional regulator